MKDLVFDLIKITLLTLILATIISMVSILEQLVDEKTLRTTSVHHNTTIDNYWGDLPWSEETKVTIVKEK